MSDEFKLIASEFERYKKKQGEYFANTYFKAREGDDNSLWKLIKWDKSWLFTFWVRSRILRKEEDDDRTFFKDLSDAINENTRFNLQSDSPKYSKEVRLKL